MFTRFYDASAFIGVLAVLQANGVFVGAFPFRSTRGAGGFVTCHNLEQPATFQPTAEYLAKAEQAIENTIVFKRNHGYWKDPRELINTIGRLRRIAHHANIFNPESVLAWICTAKAIGNATKKETSKNLSASYQNCLQCYYVAFCRANGIQFKMEIQKKKPHIPLIPKTEDVYKIINSAHEKWVTPFLIMAKTAVEPMELYCTTRKQIDAEKGIISVVGTKDHDNGVYTLEPEIAQKLREYLMKNPDENPFPTPRTLGNAWRRARNQRAKELGEPELRKIQLKSLRSYAGAIFYYTHGKDTINTMHFMRHKQLQQTIHYLRGITTFTAKTDIISKAVKLGTPNTIKEIMELANNGFTKLTEADGYQIFIKTNVQIG